MPYAGGVERLYFPLVPEAVIGHGIVIAVNASFTGGSVVEPRGRAVAMLHGGRMVDKVRLLPSCGAALSDLALDLDSGNYRATELFCGIVVGE